MIMTGTSGVRRKAGLACLAAAMLSMAGSAAWGQPGRPEHLRCEYLTSPLGIDISAPRLSWEVRDPRRGAAQSAYQVIVSTDPGMGEPGAVVWDTGQVASDRSVLVPYAGPPTTSRTRYFWRVRTWDAQGSASPYSEPAWWEMGLLSPLDWRAQWITAGDPPAAPEPLELGQWIWHEQAREPNQTVYCRGSFRIGQDSRIVRATLKITADDQYEVFVNGDKCGGGGSWAVVDQYDVTGLVKPGRNAVAVRAHNGGGPCGLIAAMRIELEGGEPIEFRTDNQWRCTTGEPDAWTGVDLDDSAWPRAVVVAQYGDAPWGKPGEKQPPRQSLCMRKTFPVKGGVARARAYVSGLGIYELRLNGRRVGRDVFTPGWTHYHKHVQYQTYDVTDLLRDGQNAVGILLGNGWWSGGLGWKGSDQYSDQGLRALVQLEIDYTDGTRHAVVTDGTWQAHPSPITRNTYYHGETYDARAEMPGWDTADFDAAGWWATCPITQPVDHLVAQQCQTIQVTQELPAQQLSEPDPGVYIFDFGQNAAGWARLKVNAAEPGTTIRLRFGEELDPNGRLYRDNYRSAEATDYYVCKGGGEETWQPAFTYRGFRYCELTGWPGAPKKGPAQDALTMCVVHTAVPQAGEFECSHWLLNRIYRNVSWGLRSNLHSVPTDCPQRDERLGWMGDAQAFAHTSCFMNDMGVFYAKWMRDVRDSQGENGAVTNVSPAMVVTEPAKPGWGDAVVIVPYTVYRFYGDTRIIEDNYEAMVGWVEYMRSQSKDNLYETPGYGDWVPVVKSPTEWIGSAYYYYSTKLLAEMAEAVGRTDDAARYAELAEAIAAAFNARHYNRDTGSYVTGTQTCNILPLFFGITPEDQVPAVLASLVADIRDRGNHLSTGFLGTTYLMTLLADRGQQALAARLATQDTYPSWGYMVRHGATTIWERWDSDKQGPSMNSRNHFAFGTVVRWFFEDLAGINLDTNVPGFRRFIIRPRPVDEVDWARATYPSFYGPITSHWRRSGPSLVLDVTIPANTTAAVYIPAGARCVAITEGDQPIWRADQPAGQSDAVRFLRTQDGFAVFEVPAGAYTFTALNRG